MSFLDVGGRAWEELANDPAIIHMGHNCNHLPLDPRINDAMIAAIKGNGYRNYPPPYGLEELRQLIRSDVDVGSADVLVTNGSTEAIYQALSVILKPGDETIVTDPAWPHIRNFALSLGSKVVEVPVYSATTKFKLLPELIGPRLTDKTRVIAIIDPLNPLGSSYTEDEIEQICNLADSRGIYLLHDCTYRDFAGTIHFPALRRYDRTIMTVSLSKSCGFAGLRLGAAIVRPTLFRNIVDHHISRLGVNIVVQRGAVVAYQTKQAWLPRVLASNRSHQTAIKKCFDSVPGIIPICAPSAGNFLAADVVGTQLGAEEIVRRVLGAGFVIRSGAYTSQNFGDKFIRVTTTVPKESIEMFCEGFPAAVSGHAYVHS